MIIVALIFGYAAGVLTGLFVFQREQEKLIMLSAKCRENAAICETQRARLETAIARHRKLYPDHNERGK
jgi:hypothetical protein